MAGAWWQRFGDVSRGDRTATGHKSCPSMKRIGKHLMQCVRRIHAHGAHVGEYGHRWDEAGRTLSPRRESYRCTGAGYHDPYCSGHCGPDGRNA